MLSYVFRYRIFQCVIFFLFTSLISFYSFQIFSDYKNFLRIKEDNEISLARYHELTTQAPYPDEENIRKLKLQVSLMKESFTKVSMQLEKQIPSFSLDDFSNDLLTFLTNIQQGYNEINEKALIHHVKLPSDFDLGFNLTTLSQIEFPIGIPISFLEWQFQLNQELLDIFLQCHISEIISWKRLGFDAITEQPDKSLSNIAALPFALNHCLITSCPVEIKCIASQQSLKELVNMLSTIPAGMPSTIPAGMPSTIPAGMPSTTQSYKDLKVFPLIQSIELTNKESQSILRHTWNVNPSSTPHPTSLPTQDPSDLTFQINSSALVNQKSNNKKHTKSIIPKTDPRLQQIPEPDLPEKPVSHYLISTDSDKLQVTLRIHLLTKLAP